MKLLTRIEVCEQLAVSGPTLYRLIRRGDAPAPLRVGPRAARWRSDEIEEFVESRGRGTEVPAR